MLGAQQVAAEGPAEQFVRRARAAGEEAGEEGRRRYGSDRMGLGESTSGRMPGEGVDQARACRLAGCDPVLR